MLTSSMILSICHGYIRLSIPGTVLVPTRHDLRTSSCACARHRASSLLSPRAVQGKGTRETHSPTHDVDATPRPRRAGAHAGVRGGTDARPRGLLQVEVSKHMPQEILRTCVTYCTVQPAERPKLLLPFSSLITFLLVSLINQISTCVGEQPGTRGHPPAARDDGVFFLPPSSHPHPFPPDNAMMPLSLLVSTPPTRRHVGKNPTIRLARSIDHAPRAMHHKYITRTSGIKRPRAGPLVLWCGGDTIFSFHARLP